MLQIADVSFCIGLECRRLLMMHTFSRALLTVLLNEKNSFLLNSNALEALAYVFSEKQCVCEVHTLVPFPQLECRFYRVKLGLNLNCQVTHRLLAPSRQGSLFQ